MRFAGSASRRPSQPVGILANFDATHYFHRMLINDNNIAPSGGITMPAAPCPTAIRWTVFRVAVSIRVRSEPRKAEISASFPLGVNLQTVRAAYIGGKRLRDPLTRNVDDGDSPISRVGSPDRFAVG